MPKESLKNLLKRHSVIILALSAILIAALCDHRNVYAPLFEYCDDIFFALMPLDTMIFPFQYVMHSAFAHCPEWLEYARQLYMLLPAALVFLVCFSVRSAMAGIVALVLSFLFYFSHYLTIDYEQIVISSGVLLSLGAFFSFRKNRIVRIILTVSAIAAMMHSKGVCQPFAAFMLILLVADTLKNGNKKKEIKILAICSTFLIFGLFSWKITASMQSGKNIGFTENNSRMIPNIMAGAEGMIKSTEGNLADIYIGKSNVGKLEIIQAAYGIARKNPGKCLKAVFLRIKTLADDVPFTFTVLILFILSFFRKKTVLKAIPIYSAAAYFYGIYIIMPIEPRYFMPAMYLMCCCGGFFVADILSATFAHARRKIRKYFLPLVKKGTDRKISDYLVATFTLPHFSLWLLSIVLLVSFPIRQKYADADYYLRIFPENNLLLTYPLRAGFPSVSDIKNRIQLFEKSEGKNNNTEWKRRWLEFLAAGQDEYEKNDNFRATTDYEINDIEYLSVLNKDTEDKNAVHWQDIMLNSIKAFGKGDVDTGEHYAEMAVLSCMLSHGYVRRSGTEQDFREADLSSRLSQESATRCSNEYTLLVLSIPKWLGTAKHNLLNSKSFRFILPENSKILFNEKNSANCDECCVSKQAKRFPSRCGIPNEMEISIIDTKETLMEDVAIPPRIFARFPAFERLKKNTENNQKINERDLITAIHGYESFFSLFDDEIMAKAAVSPEITQSEYFKYKDMAAFDLAWLYSLKGDRERTRHYLLETLRGRKDFPKREDALKAYFSLQQNTGGNNGKD